MKQSFILPPRFLHSAAALSRTIIITAFILPLLILACSKSHPAAVPPFTVTATINGVPDTFNAIITVDTVSTPGTMYVVAHADSANLTPLFEITLISKMPPPVGTYTYNYFSDTTALIQGQLGYTTWNGASDSQYTTVTDTINVTKKGPSWISGTFSGTCQFGLDSSVTYSYISNGHFTVGWPQPQ